MNKSLNYSNIYLSPEDKTYNNNMKKSIVEKNQKRQELIQQHVKSNGYIELKSDYFGTDSFYYDKKSGIMYEVDNSCPDDDKDITPLFEISYDQHIMKLNSLI